MKKQSGYYVHQNMGLIDRLIRYVVGFVLLGVPYVSMAQPGTEMQWWYGLSMLISIYPLMTALMGTDPIFRLFGVKTCGTSKRNQCGSMPYQIDAFLGREPIPDNDVEHELMHSHHVKHS